MNIEVWNLSTNVEVWTIHRNNPKKEITLTSELILDWGHTGLTFLEPGGASTRKELR
jgi:hypothetical protein